MSSQPTTSDNGDEQQRHHQQQMGCLDTINHQSSASSLSGADLQHQQMMVEHQLHRYFEPTHMYGYAANANTAANNTATMMMNRRYGGATPMAATTATVRIRYECDNVIEPAPLTMHEHASKTADKW